MLELTLSVELVALLSSVFAEILKIFPKIKENELIRSLVAMGVVVLGITFQPGLALNLQTFGSVLLFAFLNYKFIVQPVASVMGLGTQK